MLLLLYNMLYVSDKVEHTTHSKSNLMDGTHADGMWFSSWENSLLLVLIGGGTKKTSSE